MQDPLLRWRSEFPTLDHTTHMISHSLGAMPKRTRARLQQFADEWSDRSIRAWGEGWWDMPVSVGDLIGKIIGAPSRSVVMHQNVSICQQIVDEHGGLLEVASELGAGTRFTVCLPVAST